MQSILFQNSFSKMEQVESNTERIWSGRDLTCISTRIKCHHRQIKIKLINFENILIENIWKKH